MSLLTTRVSGSYTFVTPSAINVTWHLGDTGETYPQLPGVTIHDIYEAQGEGDDAFNHGVIMYEYDDIVFVAWAVHDNGEQSSGQHTICSTSTDDGVTWSVPIVACPAMDDETGGVLDQDHGRVNFGADFVEAQDSLWLICRVQDRTESTTNVGLTASKWNGTSFDAPIWIYANVSDGVAPAPISGYPAYSYGASNVVAAIRRAAVQVGKFFVKGIPLRNSFFGSEELTEMRNDRLPKPNNSIVYCHRNSAGVDPTRKYFQIAYNTGQISTAWKSGIPDVTSRSYIRRVDNVLVYVGNPEPHDGVKRNPLSIAFGTLNGNDLQFKAANIYNVYFPVPTPDIEFTGVDKLEGPQYPEILQTSTGKVLVGFSLCKESIKVARFDMPTIN